MNAAPLFHSGRRRFLRNFWAAFTASSVSGIPWTGLVLAKIAPGSGIVRLRVNDLPTLNVEGGSMRFNAGPLPPVMVNRGADNLFHAMSIVCQHQGCFVPTYDSTTNYIQCPCHGSRYAIDGSLLRGPALKGLERFTTQFDGVDTLAIRIPDLAFDAKIISVQPSNVSSARIALRFPAAIFSEYRVYQHTSLADAPTTPIAFAITANGTATYTTIKATTTGDLTVYIDAGSNRGFYSVSLALTEYQG